MNVNQQPQKTVERSALEEIQDGLTYITGHSDVSVRELITDKFILENTDFDTATNFFNSAGVRNERDLESASFNEFVKKHSRFADWEEMLIESSNQYALNHAND